MANEKTAQAYNGGGCLPAILAFGCGFAMLTVLDFLPETTSDETYMMMMLFIAFIVIILGFFFRMISEDSSRATDRNIERQLKVDKRAPVLYLRSFEADQDKYLPEKEALNHANLSNLSLSWIQAKVSFEENLAIEAQRVGPLIILSEPNEHDKYNDLEKYNVSRLEELKNEDWRSEISRYLSSSKVVVLRTSYSESIIWELKQIASIRNFKCVIFWVSFAGLQDKKVIQLKYQKFTSIVEEISGFKFPKLAPRGQYLALDERGCFKKVKSLSKAIKECGVTTVSNAKLQSSMPYAAPTILELQNKAGRLKWLYLIIAPIILTISLVVPLEILRNHTLFFTLILALTALPLLTIITLTKLRRFLGAKGQPFSFITALLFLYPIYYAWDFYNSLRQAVDKNETIDEIDIMFIHPTIGLIIVWIIFLTYAYKVPENEGEC